jgi:hypothetical protein
VSHGASLFFCRERCRRKKIEVVADSCCNHWITVTFLSLLALWLAECQTTRQCVYVAWRVAWRVAWCLRDMMQSDVSYVPSVHSRRVTCVPLVHHEVSIRATCRVSPWSIRDVIMRSASDVSCRMPPWSIRDVIMRSASDVSCRMPPWSIREVSIRRVVCRMSPWSITRSASDVSCRMSP